MDIKQQEQRLTQMIENYRNSECQSLLSSTNKKVSYRLKKAFHKARADVHTTIVTEKQRVKERIHRAQAELETKRRKQSIQADTLILELGFKNIKQQLLNSWQNDSSRQNWINSAVESALKSLPYGDWYLHHPVDWSDQESRSVIEMTQTYKINVYFRHDTTIDSGIKIEASAAVLDMTEQGLLADQQRLESRFLALFHQVSHHE